MKTKLLAILLSVVCLIQPAAALSLVTVETADEVSANAQEYEEDAKVLATDIQNDVDWKPGLNVFTGTTGQWTFDGVTDEEISSTFSTRAWSNGITYTTADAPDADGTHGTVLKSTATAANYAHFFYMVKKSLERPAFFSIDYYLEEGMPGHTSIFINYIENTGDANYGDNFTIPATTVNEWQNVYKNDSSILFGQRLMSFNAQYAAIGKSAYMDNYVLIPWYKITYKAIDADGNALGTDTEAFFIAEDSSAVKLENGTVTGIAESYPVDASVTLGADGYIFKGWATEQGASAAVTSVPLNNADITLYPVWEKQPAYTFKDGNGNYFDLTGTYTLPTAADFNFGYEPKFVDDSGNEYVPGQTASLSGDVEFTVSKSDIVLREDYENVDLTTLMPDYSRGVQENTLLNKSTIPGSGSYWLTGRTSETSQTLSQFNISTPGVYTITVDVELEITAGTYDASTVFVTLKDAKWKTLCDNVNLSAENPKASVSGKITVAQKEDGSLYLKRGSDATEVAFSDYTSDKLGIVYLTVNASDYPAEATSDDLKSKYSFYVKGLTVKFDPVAPVNTKLAGYRAPDEKFASVGIRFLSYVSADQKLLSTEYGWVVTRKSFIDNGDGTYAYEKLYLDSDVTVIANETITDVNNDGITVVAAASYIKDDIDRIFTQNGSDIEAKVSFRGVYDTFFTGVLYGIDTNSELQTSDVFVARPYIKVDGVYYYGDCHETSFAAVYEAANNA